MPTKQNIKNQQPIIYLGIVLALATSVVLYRYTSSRMLTEPRTYTPTQPEAAPIDKYYPSADHTYTVIVELNPKDNHTQSIGIAKVDGKFIRNTLSPELVNNLNSLIKGYVYNFNFVEWVDADHFKIALVTYNDQRKYELKLDAASGTADLSSLQAVSR